MLVAFSERSCCISWVFLRTKYLAFDELSVSMQVIVLLVNKSHINMIIVNALCLVY